MESARLAWQFRGALERLRVGLEALEARLAAGRHLDAILQDRLFPGLMEALDGLDWGLVEAWGERCACFGWSVPVPLERALALRVKRAFPKKAEQISILSACLEGPARSVDLLTCRFATLALLELDPARGAVWALGDDSELLDWVERRLLALAREDISLEEARAFVASCYGAGIELHRLGRLEIERTLEALRQAERRGIEALLDRAESLQEADGAGGDFAAVEAVYFELSESLLASGAAEVLGAAAHARIDALESCVRHWRAREDAKVAIAAGIEHVRAVRRMPRGGQRKRFLSQAMGHLRTHIDMSEKMGVSLPAELLTEAESVFKAWSIRDLARPALFVAAASLGVCGVLLFVLSAPEEVDSGEAAAMQEERGVDGLSTVRSELEQGAVIAEPVVEEATVSEPSEWSGAAELAMARIREQRAVERQALEESFDRARSEWLAAASLALRQSSRPDFERAFAALRKDWEGLQEMRDKAALRQVSLDFESCIDLWMQAEARSHAWSELLTLELAVEASENFDDYRVALSELAKHELLPVEERRRWARMAEVALPQAAWREQVLGKDRLDVPDWVRDDSTYWERAPVLGTVENVFLEALLARTGDAQAYEVEVEYFNGSGEPVARYEEVVARPMVERESVISGFEAASSYELWGLDAEGRESSEARVLKFLLRKDGSAWGFRCKARAPLRETVFLRERLEPALRAMASSSLSRSEALSLLGDLAGAAELQPRFRAYWTNLLVEFFEIDPWKWGLPLATSWRQGWSDFARQSWVRSEAWSWRAASSADDVAMDVGGEVFAEARMSLTRLRLASEVVFEFAGFIDREGAVRLKPRVRGADFGLFVWDPQTTRLARMDGARAEAGKHEPFSMLVTCVGGGKVSEALLRGRDSGGLGMY